MYTTLFLGRTLCYRETYDFFSGYFFRITELALYNPKSGDCDVGGLIMYGKIKKVFL